MKEHYYSNFKGCEIKSRAREKPSTLSDLSGPARTRLSCRSYLRSPSFFSFSPSLCGPLHIIHLSSYSSLERRRREKNCRSASLFKSFLRERARATCHVICKKDSICIAQSLSRTFHVYTRFHARLAQTTPAAHGFSFCQCFSAVQS